MCDLIYYREAYIIHGNIWDRKNAIFFELEQKW